MKKILLIACMLFVSGLYAQNWEKNYDYVDDCICGLSKVKKDGKIGYVDKKGTVVIPLIYSEGLTFNEGLVAVNKNNKWQYLDSTGAVITEPLYDDALTFAEGLAAVSKDGKYGFIDRTGKIIIPYTYPNARSFSEGLAPIGNNKDLWGYINAKGEFVITPQYNFADIFVNNEARVMKGDKMFYINKENKKVHE